MLVVRSSQGQSVCYEPVETIQREAMCREILAPAGVDPEIAADAKQLATGIASEINATGVMALELFLTSTGLIVNELALRPHNSGHYTIEGCATSQFEQHCPGDTQPPPRPADPARPGSGDGQRLDRQPGGRGYQGQISRTRSGYLGRTCTSTGRRHARDESSGTSPSAGRSASPPAEPRS